MKYKPVNDWTLEELEALPNLQGALKTGSKFFFSGTLCKHNHIAPRRVSGGKCIKCISIRDKKRYEKLKQKKKSGENRASKNIIKGLNPQVYLLRNAAKQRARKKNIFFNLDAKDIKIPEYCPVLGIKLGIWGDTNQNHADRSNAPSLDRIDSSLGYTKDNVIVTSYRANTIKGNGSSKEHRLIAEYIKKNTKI